MCVAFVQDGLETKTRIVDGILSALLSLKRKPMIRYLESSELCRDLATEVSSKISQENALFDWRRPDVPPLLLIMDRREDPLTPLLTQWTFQSMVHEELHLRNNRVVMKGRANVPKDMEEIPLSSEQDEFYRANMFETFDVFASRIKEKVDGFMSRKKNVGKVSTIAEMQAFLEQYPDFKREEIHVMKHFTIIPELSRLVGDHDLLKVSEIEQILACEDSHSTVVKEIRALLDDPKVRLQNKVRLIILYALRYEKNPANSTKAFVEVLSQQPGYTTAHSQAVYSVLKYAGADVRSEDLFMNKSYTSTAKRIFKQGLIPQQIDNIYLRHTPLLISQIEQAAQGKLNPKLYPSTDGGSLAIKPQDIIVFIVGGATYGEAKAIAAFNAANAQGGSKTPGVRVVLGGTTVHNSESFLEMVTKMTGDTTRAAMGNIRTY